MYGFIWRLLPGPWIVKFLLSLVLLALVGFVLMEYFFPWLHTIYPLSDPQVGTSS